MKLQVLSDLHIHEGYDFTIPDTGSDAILIAGDLGNGNIGLLWLLEQAKRISKPIYLVLGNHDLWGQGIHKHAKKWVKKFAEEAPNVTLLDQRTGAFVLMDDVLLMGSTLWTDMSSRRGALKQDPVVRSYASMCMPDFDRIKKPVRKKEKVYGQSKIDPKFSPEDSIKEFTYTLERFRKIRDDYPFNKCVIMTHHAPSWDSVAPQFMGQTLNGAFVSDLDEVMQELRADVWVHGHTHSPFNYRLGKTRVVCNPRGYPSEIQWDPDFTIEV